MSAQDARLGSTVGGKYRISRFLAQGGMGTVYEAQHVVLKRRFAVKFLRSELQQRRDMLARFQLEASAAGALESENIAAVVDFGLTGDGHPYLVMEFLDGIELAALLRALGPLPPERACDLLLQACAGMQRAHDAGVIHRDLKPQNLFVCRRSDETDLIKVVDFGVAKLLDSAGASALTSTGAMVGTPSYMAPEQARGEPRIDARTDVYALGVILYELLSGRTPHPGDSHNAVIHHISTQPPLPLAGHGRVLSPELIEVVERALSPSAEARQQSASELARQIQPFARRQVWPVVNVLAGALDSTVLAPLAAVVPHPGAGSAAPLESSGTRTPPRRVWTAFLSAAVLVAIIALVLWARAPSSSPALAAPEPVSSELQRTRPLDVQPPAAVAVDTAQPQRPPPLAESPTAKPSQVPAASAPPAPAARAIARAPKVLARPPSRAPKVQAEAVAPPVERKTAAKAGAAAEFDQQNPY